MPSLWKSWGMSVIGPAHIRSNLPNQDAWLCRRYRWGSVAVVSDGLGSKPHSDKGSRAVCEAAAAAARVYQKHPHADASCIARLIHTFWLLKIAPLKASECSATCLFVIQTGNRLILGRLGDGLIIASGEDVLMEESRANSFVNLTFCLSEQFSAEQWEIRELLAANCRSVTLCTDGIADDLLPGRQIDFADELCEKYKNCSRRERIKDMNQWLKGWPVPYHSDDKTIACLYKTEIDNG